MNICKKNIETTIDLFSKKDQPQFSQRYRLKRDKCEEHQLKKTANFRNREQVQTTNHDEAKWEETAVIHDYTCDCVAIGEGVL